jgi:hypothetical protein
MFEQPNWSFHHPNRAGSKDNALIIQIAASSDRNVGRSFLESQLMPRAEVLQLLVLLELESLGPGRYSG